MQHQEFVYDTPQFDHTEDPSSHQIEDNEDNNDRAVRRDLYRILIIIALVLFPAAERAIGNLLTNLFTQDEAAPPDAEQMFLETYGDWSKLGTFRMLYMQLCNKYVLGEDSAGNEYLPKMENYFDLPEVIPDIFTISGLDAKGDELFALKGQNVYSSRQYLANSDYAISNLRTSDETQDFFLCMRKLQHKMSGSAGDSVKRIRITEKKTVGQDSLRRVNYHPETEEWQSDELPDAPTFYSELSALLPHGTLERKNILSLSWETTTTFDTHTETFVTKTKKLLVKLTDPDPELDYDTSRNFAQIYTYSIKLSSGELIAFDPKTKRPISTLLAEDAPLIAGFFGE